MVLGVAALNILLRVGLGVAALGVGLGLGLGLGFGVAMGVPSMVGSNSPTSSKGKSSKGIGMSLLRSSRGTKQCREAGRTAG